MSATAAGALSRRDLLRAAILGGGALDHRLATATAARDDPEPQRAHAEGHARGLDQAGDDRGQADRAEDPESDRPRQA